VISVIKFNLAISRKLSSML